MGGGDSGGQGKEGDWECNGCRNRNYAFRSFCNRCKQPRLLVDNNTPANSKWLPRVGDWICTGCTNNNYASREKCKKCGQLKEVAAMPAFAMPGASLQTHPHYFPRAQGVHEQNLNLGFLGNGAFQQSQSLGSSWPIGGANNYGVNYGVQPAGRYGVQPAPTWPFVGNHNVGAPYANPVSQGMVSKGWRNGDWICTCGFHNYASRAECKKCNAAMPQAVGTKRSASDDLVQDLDSKRLNAGQTLGLQQAYATLGELASSIANQTPLDQLASAAASQATLEQIASAVSNQTTFAQLANAAANQKAAASSLYPAGSSTANSNFPVTPQLSQPVTMPALPGKGARQWRDGDWMCSSCKNHNYASRTHCNKCQTQREELTLPVSVA